MKKKSLILLISGAAAATLALGALGGYSYWHYQQPKFHDLTIELGEPMPAVEEFLTKYANPKKVALTANLEPDALAHAGEQSLSFLHGRKGETVKLTIEDTVAPVLKLKNVSADIGTELTAEDFVEEASDFSEVKLSLAEPLEEPEGYGDVTVKVVATDESGNATTQECTLSYVWMHSSLTMELGSTVSKSDILLNAQKDGALLDQAALDALTTAPVGTYPITATTADNQTATCQVTVVDTVAPELKLKDVTVYEGDPVALENFVEEAKDLAGEVTTRLLRELSTAQAGTYTVQVESADINGNVTTQEAVLTVKKDTEPPVFSGLKKLTTDKDVKPNYNSGVSANDDHDGSVSFKFDASKVDLSKPGTYEVTYTATDKAGNKATGKRTVVVLSDIKAPVFSGLKDITTAKHDAPDYTKGVTAQDNWDGKVEFTYDDSKVDLTKAGTYYVTYTAVDKAGNKETSRRKVVVNHDAEDTTALVKEIAAGLSSDPEAIRDYVRTSIKYSRDWGGDDPVWYGFKNKKGNCYVHALCLQRLLSQKGYTTKLIWVTDKSHYWLLINLNGAWKHIDATPSNTHSRYSLMNDQQRLETLSGRKWDTTQWPACE